MGCGTSQAVLRKTVSIQNSLIHLLHTNQTDKIKQKMLIEPQQTFSQCINFRGDTIAHFVCLKNNYQLAQHLYMKNPKYFSVINKLNQLPVDLTTDTRIQKLLQATSHKKCNEIQLKTKNNSNTTQNINIFALTTNQTVAKSPRGENFGAKQQKNTVKMQQYNSKGQPIKSNQDRNLNPETGISSKQIAIQVEGEPSKFNNTRSTRNMSKLSAFLKKNQPSSNKNLLANDF